MTGPWTPAAEVRTHPRESQATRRRAGSELSRALRRGDMKLLGVEVGAAATSNSMHPSVVQFFANNGDVPLIAVKRFADTDRAFDAEYELELVRDGDTKPEMEMALFG